MLLSVIIPVYNEEGTIREVLGQVDSAPLPAGVKKEIVIIDDGSTDGTREILRKLPKRFRVILHKKNKGKGGAVKTGFANASGDVFLIQDADLEYDPRDYPKLIKPILDGKARVVYGSRTLRKQNRRHSSLRFYLGGLLVTLVTNVLYLTWITDEPTCYKVFASSVIRDLEIRGDAFDWEPEVTAKILKRGIRIHEVPIRYYPRGFEEGKKIGWKDGVQAVWTLLRYRFAE